jgi:hypothetical protein
MAGKRWNGSSWVDHATKKRWNGSSWVDLTIAKRWNGSAWVDIYAGGGSSLVFTPSVSFFEDSYFCSVDDEPPTCPTSKALSDSVTYSVTGNTGAYTVVGSNYSGSSVTVDNGTPGTLALSTSCGRNGAKEGEIKVVITDTVGSITVYMPFSFTYDYDGGGEPL